LKALPETRLSALGVPPTGLD